MNPIDTYRRELIRAFPEESDRRSLTPSVLERLRKDSISGEAANFAFGIHAFATMAVPAIAARSRYTWAACLELSVQRDALVHRTADVNGADGLIMDEAHQTFRYAARVRRTKGMPKGVDLRSHGLNVRVASRNDTGTWTHTELSKLCARVDAQRDLKTAIGNVPKARPLTEHPGFQITAVVDHVACKLASLRMASGEDVIAAIEAGVKPMDELALSRLLAKTHPTDRDIDAFTQACGPGLAVERLSDAVFLWIADTLVPKFRIGPEGDAYHPACELLETDMDESAPSP